MNECIDASVVTAPLVRIETAQNSLERLCADSRHEDLIPVHVLHSF